MADTPKYDVLALSIGELSLADKPAQEGAVAPILKRHNPISQDKETLMSKDTQTKELDALRAEVETLKADAASFRAVSAFSEQEAAYYAKADKAAREAFVGFTGDEREAAIKAAAAKRDVVYTATDGTEYTKADDTKLVAMAKETDAVRKELEVQKAAVAEEKLRKRADGYSHLPGTPAEVMALLKAVDGIADGDVRDSVIKMLNSHDKGLGRSFKDAAEVEGVRFNAPESDLRKQAEAQAKEAGVSVSAAMEALLKTAEGNALINTYNDRGVDN